ncbi:MAG TPA: hypothetical protein VE033_00830, partial [Acetobacteraceae bacterium]|nr:hypothetical protein [Acetobacteraceae bacterium]
RVAGPVRGAAVSLLAGGGIVEAGGQLQAAALRLATPGDALLGSGHAVAALEGALVGGALVLGIDGPLLLAGPAEAGRATLSAEGIQLLAPLASPGSVVLRAGAGSVVQGEAGAGLRAGLLGIEGAEAQLLGRFNQVGALSGVRVDRDLSLATMGALRVAGEVSAGRLLLRADGAVTLDGARLVLGDAGLVAAPGGVQAGAPSTLVPRGTAGAPALALETRGQGALAALPSFLHADVAGVVPTTLADFGAAAPVASGPVQLRLEAGASPIFLLLGGGQAEGEVAAGRLGVLGAGGGAALTGMLGGEGGLAAARHAQVPAGAVPAYAFNFCAIGVPRCGATVAATPPPVPPPPVPSPVPLPEPAELPPVPPPNGLAPPATRPEALPQPAARVRLPALLLGATAPPVLPAGWPPEEESLSPAVPEEALEQAAQQAGALGQPVRP